VLRPVSPAVQNAASNLAAPVSPGEMITIYGSGIGPAQLTKGFPGSSGVYPTQVAGTVVEVNGTPAPVVHTSASQVSVVVPYGIAGDTAQIDVRYQDRSVARFTVGIAPAAPGIFTLDSSGKGQAAAVNSDGSTNGPAKPVHPDDVISLYATGGGQTTPGGIDGQVAWPPLAQPALPVTALIGGMSVVPEYAGAAPGMIGGVMQINLRVPRDITPGDAVPVMVRFGNMPSQPGVTIAIR
jgi:trimeric autotransporter adhesin